MKATNIANVKTNLFMRNIFPSLKRDNNKLVRSTRSFQRLARALQIRNIIIFATQVIIHRARSAENTGFNLSKAKPAVRPIKYCLDYISVSA